MAGDRPQESSMEARGRRVRGVLENLLGDEVLGRCVVAHQVAPAVPAQFAPLPEGLDERLIPALAERGVEQLYTHQRRAYDLVTGADRPEGSPPGGNGRHTVVVTPTASGKTLCYNLPVLQALLEDEGSRALYLFPTKALSQDQMLEVHDLVTAVLEDHWADPVDAAARLEALTSFSKKAGFADLMLSFKRVMNIIPEGFTGKVDRKKAGEAVEKGLLDSADYLGKDAAAMLEKGDYLKVLNILAGMKKPVDAFFDGVMVMDKDASVQKNRLAILDTVSGLFAQVADFRKIVTE